MKSTKTWCATLLCLSALACGGDDGGAEGGASGMSGGSSGAGGSTGGSSGSSGEGAAGGSTGGSSGDPGPLEYAPCAVGARAGVFSIELAPRFTGINGDVLDGVDPTFVPEVVASEGDCTLYRAPSLFCDPSCGSAESCGPDGCIPTPRTQNVGVVTVTGLVDSPIEMMPRNVGNHYTNPGSLTHPGFEEGADITLSAAGGDHSAFSLRGAGVAAIEAPSDPVRVESGSGTLVTWTAPSVDNEAVRMHINLDIARHGGTPARIECSVPDTGSFEIPETLITQLVGLGFSGFPALDLTRRSADSVEVDGLGCVELEVLATLRVDATVPGLTSCSSAADCEDGQTCQMDMTCSD